MGGRQPHGPVIMTEPESGGRSGGAVVAAPGCVRPRESSLGATQAPACRRKRIRTPVPLVAMHVGLHSLSLCQQRLSMSCCLPFWVTHTSKPPTACLAAGSRCGKQRGCRGVAGGKARLQALAKAVAGQRLLRRLPVMPLGRVGSQVRAAPADAWGLGRSHPQQRAPGAALHGPAAATGSA